MAEQIEITYGNKIFKLSTGQKITFKGGKVMQSDIVVKVIASEEEPPVVGDISFTIESVKYYADKNMTWEQWVDSEYNAVGAKLMGYNVGFDGRRISTTGTNGYPYAVQYYETIVEGYPYVLDSGGGSND